MTPIEQLHLDAIDDLIEYDSVAEIVAIKSAQITEDIAIEFMNWAFSNRTDWYISPTIHNTWVHVGDKHKITTEQLFQEFLKTKQ